MISTVDNIRKLISNAPSKFNSYPIDNTDFVYDHLRYSIIGDDIKLILFGSKTSGINEDMTFSSEDKWVFFQPILTVQSFYEIFERSFIISITEQLLIAFLCRSFIVSDINFYVGFHGVLSDIMIPRILPTYKMPLYIYKGEKAMKFTNNEPIDFSEFSPTEFWNICYIMYLKISKYPYLKSIVEVTHQPENYYFCLNYIALHPIKQEIEPDEYEILEEIIRNNF